MADRAERILAVIASLLVVFTPMLDPRISVGLAVAVLLGYTMFRLAFRRRA